MSGLFVNVQSKPHNKKYLVRLESIFLAQFQFLVKEQQPSGPAEYLFTITNPLHKRGPLDEYVRCTTVGRIDANLTN